MNELDLIKQLASNFSLRGLLWLTLETVDASLSSAKRHHLFQIPV